MQKIIKYWSPGAFFCEEEIIETDYFDLKNALENMPRYAFSFQFGNKRSDGSIKINKKTYFPNADKVTTRVIAALNKNGEHDILIGNLDRNSNGVGILTNIGNFQEYNKNSILI
jgi:hypothetical protein